MKEDAVGRLETRWDGVLSRVKERIEPLMKQVERPVGSERVPKNEAVQEYIATIAMAPDPKQAMTQRIQERMQEGYSFEQAASWFVDWAEESENVIKQIAEGQK